MEIWQGSYQFSSLSIVNPAHAFIRALRSWHHRLSEYPAKGRNCDPEPKGPHMWTIQSPDEIAGEYSSLEAMLEAVKPVMPRQPYYGRGVQPAVEVEFVMSAGSELTTEQRQQIVSFAQTVGCETSGVIFDFPESMSGVEASPLIIAVFARQIERGSDNEEEEETWDARPRPAWDPESEAEQEE